ncbi:HAD family hydrolase [Frondihabitans cladoniiphilus]|uniref:HAD family hydrolase n=1 Tax=Frondihabitans cladoniiphilus TaxID=715785 RepID=A0ABP8W6I5_9MICO
MPRPTAILFDIDGTLVDSNFLHVEAWDGAFHDCGFQVPSWKIQRAIGADGSKLLEMLLPDASDDDRHAAKDRHDERYPELADRLQILPGARDLVTLLHDRGHRVVFATSAPESELKNLRGLLDLEDALYAVTSSEDVENAKPAPDIIAVALEKAGVDPKDAVMIGDSTWDVESANKVGVRAIGVLSGGTGAADLRDAGAVEVYEDVAALRDELDSSILTRLEAAWN